MQGRNYTVTLVGIMACIQNGLCCAGGNSYYDDGFFMCCPDNTCTSCVSTCVDVGAGNCSGCQYCDTTGAGCFSDGGCSSGCVAVPEYWGGSGATVIITFVVVVTIIWVQKLARRKVKQN